MDIPKNVFDNLVEVTRAMRDRKATGKHFHTTFILDRKCRIQAIGVNNYFAQHPYWKYGHYTPYKKKDCIYSPTLHSEIDAIERLGKRDLRQFIFVNIRVNRLGELRNAAPCLNCSRIIRVMGYKAFWYSYEDNTLHKVEIND